MPLCRPFTLCLSWRPDSFSPGPCLSPSPLPLHFSPLATGAQSHRLLTQFPRSKLAASWFHGGERSNSWRAGHQGQLPPAFLRVSPFLPPHPSPPPLVTGTFPSGLQVSAQTPSLYTGSSRSNACLSVWSVGYVNVSHERDSNLNVSPTMSRVLERDIVMLQNYMLMIL